MKKIYSFILFVGVLLVGCSRETTTIEHIYLCNELEENITLTLFKNSEVFEYAIEPDSMVYFVTIDNNDTRAISPNLSLSERDKYLYSFDSAIVAYNEQLYTFTNNYSVYSASSNVTEQFWDDGSMHIIPCVLWIIDAYPIQVKNGSDNCTYFVYNEEYFENLNREIKSKCTQIDYAVNVYLENQLDNTINLEVFVDDTLSEFTLMPNDTIHFTTIEYSEYVGDNTGDAVYTGIDTYQYFVSSIDSVNVFYNDQRYTYIKPDNKIHQLLKIYNFETKNWIVAIDEDKKQELGLK
jgi:hypothetical protein